MTNQVLQSKKYLNLLSKDYPSIQAATAQIISLEAMLKLPKGTEMYMSDIHGEHEAFSHILNNASGVIREKIDASSVKNTTTPEQRKVLASLIYYPALKIEEIKQTEKRMSAWYRINIYRLIDVCRHVSSKNTRLNVRKAIPKGFEHIIDELLHAHFEDHNKEAYYNQFIDAIIENDTADDFIIAISEVIKKLAVHKLHIVGDLFDRGARPDIILDKLMDHHSCDVQWGNHDVLWMSAGAGCPLGVVSVIRACAGYNNLECLEDGYGINLRPLVQFATKTYKDTPKAFKPRNLSIDDEEENDLMQKVNKAISIIMYKLECEVIDRNPEFELQDRKMITFVDFDKGTVKIEGKDYELRDDFFPTVDKKNPAKLTNEEKRVVQKLCDSFKNCKKFHQHMRFLYSNGSSYKIENGILMFHGIIPLTKDGQMRKVNYGFGEYSGRELMDHVDEIARSAYFETKDLDYKRKCGEILWYLWCGKHSPMFGRSKMTTFENSLVRESEVKIEGQDPYYDHQENDVIADNILREFELWTQNSRIINGHVPVRSRAGENPLKANGKMIVIDGGFCKAYHHRTGIAGYTMVFSSRGLSLRAHQPFENLERVVLENTDIESTVNVFKTMEDRMLVESTDEGKEIKNEINDLKMLIHAYKLGIMKESGD